MIIHEARVDAERGDTSGGAPAALMLLAFAPNSHVRAFSDYRDLLTETGFHDIREVSETVIRATR